MRILGNRQFIVYSRGRSIRGGYLVRLYVWMARAVVAVMLLSTGVRAEYKPVDISDITDAKKE